MRFGAAIFVLFFPLAHRSRKSLGGASRNFGKRLEVDVIIVRLLSINGPYLHSPKIGGQKCNFHRFLRPCAHKRQCANRRGKEQVR